MLKFILKKNALTAVAASFFLAVSAFGARAQAATPKFKALAFFTTVSDQGHISYEHEANGWFPKIAKQYDFTYDSTRNWSDCNTANLAKYQIVIFLDTRPEAAAQRDAFKQYMDNGGAWMGFHYAGFALNNSEVPQNWDWYHKEFLGSGEYKSNTWRPTSAVLRVEDSTQPFTAGLPVTFKSSPNEWYRWQTDLKTVANIKILLSIDPTSFPLGTGPNPDEIWHDGYYPVVWTNTKYRMLYANMGHNDLDYEDGSDKQLSFTFNNDIQNKLIINTLLWLGGATTTGISGAQGAGMGAALDMGISREGSRLFVSAAGIHNFQVSVFDLQGHRILAGRTTDGTFSFDQKGMRKDLYIIKLRSMPGSVTRVYDMGG